MADLDERLTRRFGASERPVEPGPTFEALDRRRTRRAVRRAITRGSLAIAVVASTVVVSVVAAGTFGSDRPSTIVIGTGPEGPFSNGALAVADGQDLFTVDPVTGVASRIDGLPIGIGDMAYSPDGTRLVLMVSPPSGGPRELWVAEADGSKAARIASVASIHGASWAPDGQWIAYVAESDEGSAIHIARPDGSDDRIVGPTLTERQYFSVAFSPDGTSLLFDQGTDVGFGIFLMDLDGTDLRRITVGDRDYDPSWSPDGSRIAFTHTDGPMDSDVFVMDADGSNTVRLTDGADGDTNLNPVWSPDGSRIAYQAGVTGGPGPLRLIDPDGGNPRLLLDSEIFGIAWQPLPAGVAPSPEPAEPEGVDIGLEFRLCDVQRLGGIDFFGDGNRGVAWTGSPLKESGRCSTAYDAKHVVAVDHDSDGSADSWAELSQCTMCQPFDATDLGGDGSRELIVLLQASSTPVYAVYDVTPEGLPRAAGVYPISVEAPAAPEAGLPPGGQMTLWTGGDEGFSAAIRCQSFPEAPELELAWSIYSISDSELGRTTTEEYHFTRLRLVEPDASGATFVVLETTSTTQAIAAGLPFETPASTCGVRWLD